MSFLLPDPGKPTRRNTNNISNRNSSSNNNNNHGGGGVARLSMRSNSNYSATGSSNFIGGDNTTIVPRPRDNTSLLNRGGGSRNRNQNQNQSQQQISGNQIMLQRQKRTTTTTTTKTKQQLQQRQQQQPVKQQEQDQENLLGTSMEDIMKDIAILEQQQRDAQRKLESAQTTKENKLNQQRQLNTLLEKKKYSNGALRAKLQQCRDFLSGATRDLGSCKLGTDRFQREIGEFNDKLNKGIRSAKMIEVCNAKIDSLINLTEHKVSKISRLKRDRMDKTKKARMKYEQTEKEDRMLRSAIQDVHKKAREWAEEKASLRGEISKLDSDKMSAQNTEQSTELRVQSACDQIKSEEDRTFQVKDTQLTEIDETVKQKEIIRTEIVSMSDSIHTLKLDLQAQKEKIIECQKVEEGHPISTTSIDDEDYVPVFDQNSFRMDLTKLEAVAKKEDDELNSLTSSIEEMERTLQESKKETLKNEEETTMLDSSAKSMSEEEENRRGETEKFQTILETTRTEVAKLKDSFREMEEIREAGVQTHYKAMADCDAEISKYTELIEDLKLKTKGEDTTLKTRIRLFEEEEKPKLLAALKAAEKGSRRAEKKHKDLIDMSTEASIESKLQAEYEFEKKFNDEKMKWEAKVRNIVVKRDTILEEFPELQNIEFTFDRNDDMKKQIDVALSELKKDCSDRVAAINAIKGRKIKEKKERQLQSEAAKAKLKRKEEAKAKLKRSQLREEASCRANDLEGGSIEDTTPPRVNDIARRQERNGKGSNFFDPRSDDKTGDLNVETPAHPRKLISSFSQSQSSSGDKRVRWGDDVDVDVEDDRIRAEEESVESHFEGDGELSENRHEKGMPTKTTKVTQYSKSILRDVNVNTNNNEENSRSSKLQIDTLEVKKQTSVEEKEDLQKETADSEFAFTEDNGSKKISHRRRSSNRINSSNGEKQDEVGELRKELTRSSRITREDESLNDISSTNDNDDNAKSRKRSSSSRVEDRDRRAKQRKKSDNSTRDSSSSGRIAVTGSRVEVKKSSSSSLRGRKSSDISLTSKDTNATAIQKSHKSSSSSSSSSTRRNHNSEDNKSGRGSELAGKVPPKDKGQRQKSRSSRSIDKDPRKEGKDSSTGDRHESILVKATSSKIKDRDERKTNIGSKAPGRTSRESRRERSSSRDDASLKSVSSRGRSEKKRSNSISSRSKGTEKESREKRRNSDDASVKSVSSRGSGEKKRSNSSSSSSSIRSKGTEKESREKRRDSDDASVKSVSSKGRVEKERSSSSDREIEKGSREKRRGSDDASVKSFSSKGRVEKKRSQSREKRRDGDDASVNSVSSKGKTGRSKSRSSSSSNISESTGKESREKQHDGVRDDASIKSVSSKGKTVKSKSHSSSNSSKSAGKESHEKQRDGVRDGASVKSVSSKGKTAKSKSRSSSNSSKSTDKVSRDATSAKDKISRTKSDKSTGVRKESRGKGRENPSTSGARENSSVRGDIGKTHQSLKARSSSSQGNGASKKRKINEDITSVSTSATTATTATTNARRRKRRGTLSQKSTTTNMTDDAGFNF